MRILFTAILCLLMTSVSLAQELTVSGTVTDSKTKEPLSGVLISLSTGGGSTYTGPNGEFKLAVSDGYENLTISLEGYASEKVFIGGRNSIEVALKSGDDDATESSPTQISSADLGNQPVVDLEQSTQGRAAGVFVQNSGGRLGQGTKVRIRGGSSLTGSNEPLYVVDGVPLTSDNQSDIDPSSVESMEILKDAAATAIYGSRAANGVVLITTKKGKSGKIKADVEYQFGVSETMSRLDMMSPLEYNAMFIEYNLRNPLVNAGVPAADITRANLEQWALDAANGDNTLEFSNGNGLTIPILSRLSYDTDWQDLAFRRGLSNRGNVNLSGGSSKQQYFANVNYLDQEGILINNDYQRYGGRFNLSSSWTSKLSSNLSIGYAKTNNNRVNEDANDGNPVQMALLPPSDEPNPNNDYILRVRSSEYNPQTEVYGSDNFESTDRLNGSASINYSLADNLILHVDGGLDYLNLRDERRQGPATQEGAPNGFSRLGTSEVFNYLFNGTLNYGLDMGDNSLSIMAGTSYQRSTSMFSYKYARINSIPDLEALPESNALLTNNPIPGAASAFISFFGFVGYDIDDRYSVEVTARMDGSSRFSPENRYGVFPAASLGWTLSNESFLSGVSAVSFLKLNASYGILGNTPYEDFLYQTNYYTVNYGETTGYRVTNLSNNQMKWESTQQVDVSLEYGFLDNRISGSINYYQKNTTDLLFPVPVTQTSGVSNVIKNSGQLLNSGFEFSLSTLNVDKGNFSWQTSFNISSNQNEIKDLGGQRLISGGNAFIEGEAAGVFYLPEYLGVNPLNGAAQYDNGSGLPTEDYDFALANGRKVVGNPNPKYFGGLSNSISYKSFDFSFMFQFVEGMDSYWETGEIIANSGFALYNQTKDQLNRWYEVGDEADYPVLSPTVENTNPSSRWIVDASYIRLKTVTLSYSLPDDLVSRLGMRQVSVYIGGQNLLTFTDYPGYDPDVSYSDPAGGSLGANINKGIDFFTAPQPRVYTTGIKIGF